MHSYLLAGLIMGTGLLCGCSRVVMPASQPAEANRFFVCSRCGGLCMLLDADPPSEIPAHAKICSHHTWKQVSQAQYVSRASKRGMSLMPQPSSDLDLPTPFGQVRFLLYPGALVLVSGAGNFMVSASDPRGAALAALMIVILLVLVALVARSKRQAQPPAGGNAE